MSEPLATLQSAQAPSGHPGLPRLLAGLRFPGEVLTASDHEQIHGPLPPRSGSELIELVERSGLRGRGGADFPAARKLRAVAAARGGASAVVVNGSETEPESAKDRLLLTAMPHLVLDGALLAAQAVGAGEVIVKVSESAHSSLKSLQGAISVRDDRIPVRVVAGPDGYVTGEESAVMHYLNGGQAVPTFVPPRPFERGYRNRPTLVNNPETLAQVALIARFGDRWFRELGTVADPGSVLITISGAVASPGVYELEFGIPMVDLLAAAGAATEPLQALLIGGYFGTWVDSSSALRIRLARTDLSATGASLGSGVIFALGQGTCGLRHSARVVRYLAGQSAGQCGPCKYGLPGIADLYDAVAHGLAQGHDHQRLLRWISEVRGRGACHHPDGVARFAQSGLEVFADEIELHRVGRCSARSGEGGPAVEGRPA